MQALKSRDVAILLKMAGSPQKRTISVLATELFLSPSEVHQSIMRAGDCKLYDLETRGVKVAGLHELIAGGIQYVFPALRGQITRGMPTSIAAPPLVNRYFDEPEIPPVWSHPMGLKRGYGIEPLYKRVPDAAAADFRFYEILSLVDAIREGGPRARKIALDELERRFDEYNRFLQEMNNDEKKTDT